MNGNWNEVASHLSKVINQKITFKSKKTESGGCINQCWKITDAYNKHWFIKTNSSIEEKMFSAEFEGLKEITNSKSIRVPNGICYGSTKDFSYLILEFIPMKSLSNMKRMGEHLAKMHQTSSQYYGWKRDNTIGLTPQSNTKHSDWISFWREERLRFQLDLALKNGYALKAYDDGLKLLEEIPTFFTTHQVTPSLLHGDLWGGNAACDLSGTPVIFDPAVFYGDRETDIAMTELFGGFNDNFYSSYTYHFPLDKDYKIRKNLYNLYHILNHFNLFKGGYAIQASNITLQLLSEI